MRFNVYTCYVSWAILAITALYTLLYSGLTGLLFTGAVGLVVAAFLDSVELIVAITVIFALLYTMVLKRFLARIEPFEDSPQKVIQRIASVQKKGRRNEPTGVYDASVEGFEDIQPQVPKEGAASDSSSASAQRANQVDPKQVSEVTSATPPPSAPASSAPASSALSALPSEKEIEKEEFQSATNELFKLGKMPSEHAEGPKLDVGQTVMKAMSSLDPNTISSMTTDTKKLLDTQKGLMSMLTQMRPVLADGKELLQTFTSMFGNGGPVKL